MFVLFLIIMAPRIPDVWSKNRTFSTVQFCCRFYYKRIVAVPFTLESAKSDYLHFNSLNVTGFPSSVIIEQGGS